MKSLLLGDPLLIHGTIVYVPLFAYMIKQRIIVLVLDFFSFCLQTNASTKPNRILDRQFVRYCWIRKTHHLYDKVKDSPAPKPLSSALGITGNAHQLPGNFNESILQTLESTLIRDIMGNLTLPPLKGVTGVHNAGRQIPFFRPCLIGGVPTGFP